VNEPVASFCTPNSVQMGQEDDELRVPSLLNIITSSLSLHN